MLNNELIHTSICITDRGRISMNGIMNILSFDDGLVTLETGSCIICVEGRELKIESLCHDNGEIVINGKIDGVYYEKERKSAFKRWRFFE